MRHFDFAPLYRATVGFDQIADIMDRALTSESSKITYPPYNIEKKADDTYRISVAVAGILADDIIVEVKENALFLAAKKPEIDESTSYLHRGIATRSFERHFQLADHVQVVSASHIDGMLHIDLKRQVPEALKARRIEISQPQGNVIAETAIN
jgi:molecular chaperone IbpA